MNIKDLREKTEAELNDKLLDLLREQFGLRMQKATGQLSQTHLIGQVRKNIARVRTVLSEKYSINKAGV